jgi:hypothetical protein
MACYVSPQFTLFAVIAACGVIVSVWNLKLVQRAAVSPDRPGSG